MKYSMVSVSKLMRLHAEFGFTHACDGDAMSVARSSRLWRSRVPA